MKLYFCMQNGWWDDGAELVFAESVNDAAAVLRENGITVDHETVIKQVAGVVCVRPRGIITSVELQNQ